MSKKQWHKDWRLWVIVVLAIAAMLIYVLTMDESIQPGIGGANQTTTPATKPSQQ